MSSICDFYNVFFLQDSKYLNRLYFKFQVRFAASCALMSFLLENVDNNQYIRKFSDLLPLMLKVSFKIITVSKS